MNSIEFIFGRVLVALTVTLSDDCSISLNRKAGGGGGGQLAGENRKSDCWVDRPTRRIFIYRCGIHAPPPPRYFLLFLLTRFPTRKYIALSFHGRGIGWDGITKDVGEAFIIGGNEDEVGQYSPGEGFNQQIDPTQMTEHEKNAALPEQHTAQPHSHTRPMPTSLPNPLPTPIPAISRARNRGHRSSTHSSTRTFASPRSSQSQQ